MSRTSTCTLLSGFGLLLLLVSSSAKAQTNRSAFTKAYLQLGLGASSHDGASGQLSVQTVLKNNWIASFSYHNIDMDPKGMPGDYKPGFTMLFILPLPDSYPEVNIKTYSLAAGKLFELGRRTWATTEAGISLVKGDQYIFQRQAVMFDGWIYTSPTMALPKHLKPPWAGFSKLTSIGHSLRLPD